MQNILGDPRGVESQIRALIVRWEKLAGSKSERIDELLNDLGFYYVQAGQGSEAQKTFEEIRTRIAGRAVVDGSDHLRADLDLIEIGVRFNRETPENLIAKTQQLADTVSAQVDPGHQRFRQLLARAATVLLTLGRTDLAQKYVEIAQSRGRDISTSNTTRMNGLHASMARAAGKHDENVAWLRKRIKMFDDSGEKTSLRRSYAQIDLAYAMLLQNGAANQAETLQTLALARASLPNGLPDSHLVFRQFEYVSALANFGPNSGEFKRAQTELAQHFGRNSDALPGVLTGLFVQS